MKMLIHIFYLFPIENGPFDTGMFQPAMLVYPRVSRRLYLENIAPLEFL